jgi:hypothetical protein
MVTPKSCIWYQPLLILHHQQVPINIEFVGFFYLALVGVLHQQVILALVGVLHQQVICQSPAGTIDIK